MKSINFDVDEDLYTAFRSAVDKNGMKVSGAFKSFMREYADGTYSKVGNPVVGKPPVGRPSIKIEKKEEPLFIEDYKSILVRDKAGELVPWYDRDHSKRALYDFPIPHTMSIGCDNQAPLKFETEGRVTRGTFEDFIVKHYFTYASKYNERDWRVLHYDAFIGHCAAAFFTLNRIDDMRFDIEVLRDKMEWLRSHSMEQVEQLQAYDAAKEQAAN